jgi:hypothetical protein
MLKSYRILLLFILATCIHVELCAQVLSRSVVCAGGDVSSTPQLSISYTIGEAFGGTQINASANRTLTIGILQPDIELKEILDRDLSKNLTVFPNPTTDGLVKLGLNRVADANYTIDILDVLGRVLQSTKVVISNSNLLYVPLNISSLSKGTYFIRVRGDLNFRGQVKLVKL